MHCFRLQTRHQGHRKPPLPSQASQMGLETKNEGHSVKSNKEAATGESQGTKGSRGPLSARGGRSGKRMFQLDF